MREKVQPDNIALLKLLSDPSRFKILQILIKQEGNICVNEIAQIVKISPSAVSHQLSKLERNMLIQPVRKGQNVCYKMRQNQNTETVRNIISILQ